MMNYFINKIIQNYEKKIENPRFTTSDLEQKMLKNYATNYPISIYRSHASICKPI